VAAVMDYRAPTGTQVQLRPIPWGRRDQALGFGVCEAIARATPPTVIPANPLLHSRLRGWMLSHGIAK
jgi:hypothetical protein